MASEQVIFPSACGDPICKCCYDLVRSREERGEWQARCISRGKENDELRDEIARLRRAFPVDRLREYDRRRKEAA